MNLQGIYLMKSSSFAKGVVLLTGAAVIVKLAGFVYRVALTNLPGYGDAGNGLYGAGFQVYLVLYAFSTTGFPSAIAKLVAEKRAIGDGRGAHRVFKTALWLLLFIGFTVSVLFFLLSGSISSWISNPRTHYTMLALSPTIFFVSIMAAYRGYFQGMHDMTPQASSQVIEQLVKTAFTIFLAYLLIPKGVEAAAAGATLGTTIGAAAGAFYLLCLYNRRKREIWRGINKSALPGKSKSAASIVRELLKIAAPISLGAVVLTAANIIDLTTVMGGLGRAGFDEATANELYGVLTGKCYVLTNFPVSVTTALSTSLVPAVAAAMSRKDIRSASAKISASLRLTVLISLPSTAGLAILAGPVLRLLFPGSSEGDYLLVISALGIVFVGLTQTMSGILQGLGKPLLPAVSLLFGAAAKISVNHLLIPMQRINIRGAAYGTLAFYVVSALICAAALKMNFRLKLDPGKFIIKPLAAASAMGAVAYYLYGWLERSWGNPIATPLTIAVSALLYGTLLLVLGAVTWDEISSLPFGKNIVGALPRRGRRRR